MSPTIEGNVQAWLRHFKIFGVILMDEPRRPDRVFAWDVRGSLLKYCYAHTRYFTRDSGRNHGPSVRGSFREKAKPSMQVCVHECSPLDPNRLDECFLEIDFDEANPFQNPQTLVVHGVEVISNKIGERTTDQADIARRLAERLGPEALLQV